MEWMEVIGTGLALDSGAVENWGWLPFKETIRRAINQGVCNGDHYRFSPLYVHPQEMTLCMICRGSRHCRDLDVVLRRRLRRANQHHNHNHVLVDT